MVKDSQLPEQCKVCLMNFKPGLLHHIWAGGIATATYENVLYQAERCSAGNCGAAAVLAQVNVAAIWEVNKALKD